MPEEDVNADPQQGEAMNKALSIFWKRAALSKRFSSAQTECPPTAPHPLLRRPLLHLTPSEAVAFACKHILLQSTVSCAKCLKHRNG
jgi:hypothetical protein